MYKSWFVFLHCHSDCFTGTHLYKTWGPTRAHTMATETGNWQLPYAICHFVLWPTLSAQLFSRVIQKGLERVLLIVVIIILQCVYRCVCVGVRVLHWVICDTVNKQTNMDCGEGKKANWLLHCTGLPHAAFEGLRCDALQYVCNLRS